MLLAFYRDKTEKRSFNQKIPPSELSEAMIDMNMSLEDAIKLYIDHLKPENSHKTALNSVLLS